MNSFLGYGRRVSSEDECPGKREARCTLCPIAENEDGETLCGAHLHYKDERDNRHPTHFARKNMNKWTNFECRLNSEFPLLKTF